MSDVAKALPNLFERIQKSFVTNYFEIFKQDKFWKLNRACFKQCLRLFYGKLVKWVACPLWPGFLKILIKMVSGDAELVEFVRQIIAALKEEIAKKITREMERCSSSR